MIISDGHERGVTPDTLVRADFRLRNRPFGHSRIALVAAGSLSYPWVVAAVPLDYSR